MQTFSTRGEYIYIYILQGKNQNVDNTNDYVLVGLIIKYFKYCAQILKGIQRTHIILSIR